MLKSLRLSLLLLAAPLSATTVYQTVDRNGNVQYSDRPDSGDAKALTLRVQRPSSSGPIRTAAAGVAGEDVSAAETASEETSETRPTAQQRREEAARRAKRRAENCAIARERLERYMISHRLYRPLPNGERHYLSAGEIDEARAKAQTDVQEWCD